MCPSAPARRRDGNSSYFASAINVRGSKMRWRAVLLSTVLLASWSILPSCRGRQGQGSFLKEETDYMKNLTTPNGSYLANDHDKRIGPFGSTAAWEFDTPMSSEAYIRWVSLRLGPSFTPRANPQPPFIFSRYRDGEKEIIRIDTTSRSGKLHVLVTLDLYPD